LQTLVLNLKGSAKKKIKQRGLNIEIVEVRTTKVTFQTEKREGEPFKLKKTTQFKSGSF
jgi:hypothetical protein